MSNKDRKQVTLSKFFTSKGEQKSSSIKTDDAIIDGHDGKYTKSKSRMKRPPSQEGRNVSAKLQRTRSPDSISVCTSSSLTNGENTNNKNAENSNINLSISESTKKKLSTFLLDSEISHEFRDDNYSKKQKFTDIKFKQLSDTPEQSSSEYPVEKQESSMTMIVSDDEDGVDDNDTSVSKEKKGFTKLLAEKTSLQKSSLCVNKTTKTKYTPLETQFMEIKESYPDAVLFVECGYKYRFFGEDAEIASRVLKIFCHPDHNFQTASIPTHRLFVHVRRLVSAGYKVGVVKQTETTALKAAGENRGGPFSRKLSALYTKSTLIGEDVDPLSGIQGNDPVSDYGTRPNHFLLCVYDSATSRKDKQEIAIVAVDPSTGDILYDCFVDDPRRAELESRLGHIQPVELLIPNKLTQPTEKLLNDVVALSSTEDDRIRIERLGEENFHYAQAFQTVSEFYTDGTDLQFVLSLQKPVLSCLAGLIIYLKDFHLDRVLKLTSSFQQFSMKLKFLQIGGNSLRNLEVFQNVTDGHENGSLFWVLNHTVSKFGARMLRSWVTNPLMDVSEITKRQDAVQELCAGALPQLQHLRQVLSKMPDVDKGLCSIYHKKCSVAEFYTVAKSLEKIHKEMKMVVKTSDEIQSTLIQDIVTTVPSLLADITKFCLLINDKAAKENDKPNLFTDESVFPIIVERKAEIENIKKQLRDHRKEVRLQLGQPSLDYVSVLQTEFLVEVKNAHLKLVPSDWTKINSTKTVSRFHTPFIVDRMKKLSQLKEQLLIDSNNAWQEFLETFSEKYLQFRRGVEQLAVLDCLFSLSTVAQQQGYCRPQISADSTCIDIEDGRHPVIDILKSSQDQFVPNSTHLSADGKRVMIITGPNMGGKSSYIRQVALITIMAQIGSFVPASSATLGVVDAIFTRMGAADEIFKGRSTFMVELQEASEIMSHATSRSLVILDELGRGTSTHDGVAIAHATLQYFINEVKCLTLFVTHYPVLSELENQFPDAVGNYHMSFILHENEETEPVEDGEVITFLYQLVEGRAAKSYGLNVARLADISQDIIKQATEMSHRLETKLTNRRLLCDIFTAISTKSVPAILKLLKENDDNR